MAGGVDRLADGRDVVDHGEAVSICATRTALISWRGVLAPGAGATAGGSPPGASHPSAPRPSPPVSGPCRPSRARTARSPGPGSSPRARGHCSAPPPSRRGRWPRSRSARPEVRKSLRQVHEQRPRQLEHGARVDVDRRPMHRGSRTGVRHVGRSGDAEELSTVGDCHWGRAPRGDDPIRVVLIVARGGLASCRRGSGPSRGLSSRRRGEDVASGSAVPASNPPSAPPPPAPPSSSSETGPPGSARPARASSPRGPAPASSPARRALRARAYQSHGTDRAVPEQRSAARRDAGPPRFALLRSARSPSSLLPQREHPDDAALRHVRLRLV